MAHATGIVFTSGLKYYLGIQDEICGAGHVLFISDEKTPLAARNCGGIVAYIFGIVFYSGLQHYPDEICEAGHMASRTELGRDIDGFRRQFPK